MTRHQHNLTWLPKPIYKQVRLFSALVLTLLFTLGFNAGGFWVAGLISAVCISVVTGWAAFNLKSCYFVHAVTHLPGGEGVVCITFDDGPCAQTAHILDKLKQENVRATFFCVGKQVERYPAVARRIVDEGHTLGNHSFSHTIDFPLKGVGAIRRELLDTQTTVESIAGRAPSFFRPPFGVTNPLIASALAGIELTTIGWSVRSLDTVIRRRTEVLARIEKHLKPGSIILLHDHADGAVELLNSVIQLCRSKNLMPVSMDEAFDGHWSQSQNAGRRLGLDVVLDRQGV